MTLHPSANGHRRRELRKRVLREEHHCALCGLPVDKTLKMTPGDHGPKCPTTNPKTSTPCQGCVPHPQSAVVDEDIPRVKGGSPYSRGNCHLMHRRCNRWKSTMTLNEARAKWDAQKRPKVTPSPGW